MFPGTAAMSFCSLKIKGSHDMPVVAVKLMEIKVCSGSRNNTLKIL